MELVGSTFEGRDRLGDFRWMITRPEFADVLFVFNDNEEQYLAFRRDPTDRTGRVAGGGNAAIRPYRAMDPPRAAGIPTGRAGQGYALLTDDVCTLIDDALAVVAELAGSGRYGRLVYSAAADTGALGTGIFVVGEDVKRHIMAGLRAITNPPG